MRASLREGAQEEATFTGSPSWRSFSFPSISCQAGSQSSRNQGPEDREILEERYLDLVHGDGRKAFASLDLCLEVAPGVLNNLMKILFCSDGINTHM